MNAWFLQFLEISLQASFMGAFIWLLLKTPLSKVFSAKVVYLLWSLLLVRFLIPGNIHLSQDLLPMNHGIVSKGADFHMLDPFDQWMPEFDWLVGEFDEFEPVPNSVIVEKPVNIGKWISVLWMAGIAVVALAYFAQMGLFHFTLKRAHPVQHAEINQLFAGLRQQLGIKRPIPLIEMEGIGSAVIIGLVNPKIILSSELIQGSDEQHLKTVLVHELTHYKQGHSVMNFLGLIVCGMHWFNPLAWIFYRELRLSIELACDEAAVASEAIESSESYANHLLDLISLVPKGPPHAIGLLGLFNNLKTKFLKTRIHMINQNSKNKKLPTLFVLIIGLLGICMGSTQLDSNQTQLQVDPDFEDLRSEVFKDFSLPASSDALPETRFSELKWKVDAFGKDPQFSDAAKKIIKEEVVTILNSGDPLKALPLLLDSRFENDSQVQFLIGNIYLQKGKTNEAELHYIQSFNGHAYSRPLKNLILIYVNTGHIEVAGQLVEKYIELADSGDLVAVSSDLYRIAGYCAMTAENYPLAEKRFIESLALDGENKNNLLNLFQAYMFQERYKKAEQILEKLIAKTEDPAKLATYYKYYANTAIGLDVPKQALERLETVFELVEKDQSVAVQPTSYSMASAIAFNRGDHEKALEIAEKYIALTHSRANVSPEAEIYYVSGLNAMFLEKNELALDRLEKCLELDPDHKYAKEQIAKVRKILG